MGQTSGEKRTSKYILFGANTMEVVISVCGNYYELESRQDIT